MSLLLVSIRAPVTPIVVDPIARAVSDIETEWLCTVPGAHAFFKKLSTTFFSPALSNWMVSLLPSTTRTRP